MTARLRAQTTSRAAQIKRAITIQALCMERDVPDAEYVDVAKITAGGICPNCGKHTIKISRGIEVGNIFQLGTKIHKEYEYDIPR